MMEAPKPDFPRNLCVAISPRNLTADKGSKARNQRMLLCDFSWFEKTSGHVPTSYADFREMLRSPAVKVC